MFHRLNHRAIVSMHRYLSTASSPPMAKSSPSDIFDRRTKHKQRDYAAAQPDADTFNYLREEFGFRLADRVYDIKRTFPIAIDIQCGRGHVCKHLSDDILQRLILCDSSAHNLKNVIKPEGKVQVEKMVIDDENLPFKSNFANLIISNLSLHWINDPVRTFSRILEILEPDGVFIGSIIGGQTLYELRCALQLAETEREGGFGLHVSPLIQAADLGRLLSKSGFNLITIDSDEIVINYPSIYELMFDLQSMGESNCLWNRKVSLNRTTMLSAAAIYRDMYGNNNNDEDKKDGDKKDGDEINDGDKMSSIPATFQVYNFIGWKPHESQPIPEKRGTGQFSLKNLHNLDDVINNKK